MNYCCNKNAFDIPNNAVETASASKFALSYYLATDSMFNSDTRIENEL